MDLLTRKIDELRNVETRYIYLDALDVKAIDPKLVRDNLPAEVQSRVTVDDFNEIMATIMAFHALAAINRQVRDAVRYSDMLER